MSVLKIREKDIKKYLLIITALYFIIGLYFALRYGSSNLLGSMDKMDNDDVKYIRSAWTLLDTGVLTYHNVNEPTVFIMPGLTYTLAFFMKIFGRYSGIAAFRVFQIILQTISIYMLFLIGRKTFNSKTALSACIIYVLYAPEYYVPTLILTETIFKFLLLALIYITIYAIEEKKIIYYTLGGVVWGIACLFRPTIAAYPLVVFVIWLVKKYSFKNMVKCAAVTLAMFCLVMSPWWVRNYNIYGKFIPTTQSAGNPFLQGTYINYDQTKDYTPYKVSESVAENDRTEIETGLYRLRVYGSREPLKYLIWYTLGKTFYFWVAPFYWKALPGMPYICAQLFHILILIAAVMGTIKMFKTENSTALLVFLVPIYFNIMYLPFFTFSRYSYPIMPLIDIFAAYAVLGWIEKERNKYEQNTGCGRRR